MSCIHRPLARVFAFVVAGALLAQHVAADVVEVSPAQPGNWIIHHVNTARWSFVEGPGDPPVGRGSLKVETGIGTGRDANGQALGGKLWVGSTDLDGITLGQLTRLTYSVYIESAKLHTQRPYINLHLDTNGNGVWDGRGGGDDILVFDPPVARGESFSFETWDSALDGGTEHDALAGTWWVVGGQSPVEGLNAQALRIADLVDQLGDRKLVFNGEAPGISLVVGTSTGDNFAEFVGYIDNITIGIDGEETTYDFEATPAAAGDAPSFTLLDREGGDASATGGVPVARRQIATPRDEETGQSGSGMGSLLVVVIVIVVLAAVVIVVKRKAA